MARPKKRKAARGSRPGGLGGGLGGNPMDLMAQVQKMQEEMARVQEALAEETIEVTAGGGAVAVVITGQQVIKSIKIDPDLLDPEDVEMLEDLLLAAVNQAIERSQALAAERMQAITGGLSIPGLL